MGVRGVSIFPVVFLLCACASLEVETKTPENIFTILEKNSKLKMRDVKFTVNDNGDIVLSSMYYENLSKNISDIYADREIMKKKINFYEQQILDSREKE